MNHFRISKIPNGAITRVVSAVLSDIAEKYEMNAFCSIPFFLMVLCFISENYSIACQFETLDHISSEISSWVVIQIPSMSFGQGTPHTVFISLVFTLCCPEAPLSG